MRVERASGKLINVLELKKNRCLCLFRRKKGAGLSLSPKQTPS